MLNLKKRTVLVVPLLLIFVLTSCRNGDLPWREGKLVTQMYRQYKQEILLAYNDFEKDMIVDDQHGYARAYFDNYRNQIIFTTQWTLDYMLGGQQITTSTEDVTGYVYRVLFNDKYQIGVEILDIERSELGKGDFDGARVRIINLSTKENTIITGFPSHFMLTGNYVYAYNFDNKDNRFLDIINVETMKHERLNTTVNDFTFFYEMGDKVFVQDAHRNKTFLIENDQLIEQATPIYNIYPNIDEGSGSEMLKDIAPTWSNEHWYINPLKQYGATRWAELLRFFPDKVERVFIDFKRDDIVRIGDVANYGEDKVAILLTTKDDEDQVHAIINVYDMQGQKISEEDITHLRGDNGRFTYLDYVE